jgi:hypothetical protein
MLWSTAAAASDTLASWVQRKADGSIDVVVDIPSTIMVVGALVATLVAVYFARQFSRTIGGDLGAGFKFVDIGLLIFAVTRVDDVLKISGMWAKWGIDYKRTLWLPHSLIILVAFVVIAFGFYRMTRAFKVE